MIGEFYHIYNRGNNKRPIFLDNLDASRFLLAMQDFNSSDAIGSIYEYSFRKKFKLRSSTPKQQKIVKLVAYCLNPNHYHLLVKEEVEGGISKFLHKLGTGYTNYFNARHKNSGALFQGRYKSVHVDSNNYLLYLSAYINLNSKVHQPGNLTPGLVSQSSWGEYIDRSSKSKINLCNKEIVLSQFNKTEDYKKFAEEALPAMKDQKCMEKSIKWLLGS